ncbi:MAG: wax ester/triacylglycerol synthase family O-acyltransferase, partial [Betaproteobacteria bacterium]|nr:wax ester/triacylglycerol synthase family O-acyltransferase [Betaproteobacteria bacterium]
MDAAFLQLETAETPMHLASVHLLELPPDYRGDYATEVFEQVKSRLHLAPMLCRKLATMPLD